MLRRALAIALEIGIEYEAGFAYTNLHELHCANRDYAKADPYFHDGRPARVSANWPRPTGCSSPGTTAVQPNCSMRWAAPTTRRSRSSMRLTS